MSLLERLEPQRVFYYFEEICKIPHGSGNTQAISDYLVTFAKEHLLAYHQDKPGNVIIYKNASAGYENSKTVILQGHMDMVCEKSKESDIDFTKDGIPLMIHDDWIEADGTTLGADNGIAVAYALAVLEDMTLSHPPLEIVLTVDEEVGLIGACGLDTSLLKGRLLLNLDSEEEGFLWCGCAGGVTVQASLPVRYTEETNQMVTITLEGLRGGHSGAEIHKNRGNAVLLLGRFLFALRDKMEYSLADFDGGTKNNAIPRQAKAGILAPREQLGVIRLLTAEYEALLRKEYAGSEPDLHLSMKEEGLSIQPVLEPGSLAKVLFILLHLPNGVLKMSGVMDGLVETSSNAGIVALSPQALCINCGIRSNLDGARDAVKQKMIFLIEFLGGEAVCEGEYPAWEYRQNSMLRKRMVQVYADMFGKEPVTKIIHAGLECGIFYKNINELDCISLGPNMEDIHTTKERLSIFSVQRVYQYLLETLKQLK